MSKTSPVASSSKNTKDSEPLELLGIVAHDLKMPISSIKSYADLIGQSGELNERQQLYLSRIDSAIQTMIGQINDLLDLVWLESGMELKIRPCNLLEVVRDQIAALEAYAQRRNITFHLTYGETLAPILGDERRLGQVVSNLLGNAIKYSRPGGHVWVHVERLPDTLRVIVRDEGIGISAEDLPRVFDRFFRAQNKEMPRVEGSGLGLSIAKAIVEQHGGRIDASSILGKGSTFQMTLPWPGKNADAS